MPFTRRHALRALLIASTGSLPGCAWMRTWMGPRDPFAAGAPCVLRPDATAVEVVNHLNANTAQIRSWQSDHVKIAGRGAAQTPVSVGARIVVESPRNLRLIVSSPTGGEEVDLGSNATEFWFWNRRAEEKYVFVAYHDQNSVREGRRFPIPFQPEWVMEAFGVIPINADNVTANPGPVGSRTIQLVSDHDTPQGERVRKIAIVDICHGVIVEQALYDKQGRLVASARMSHFANHAVPGTRSLVVLPKQIDIDWPKENLGFTMAMNHIEINPSKIPERIWERPTKEGYAVYEMSQ